MSTQETAKFNVDIVLSTDGGELPTDEWVAQALLSWFGFRAAEAGVHALSININSRTGEL